jgi:hypothetical protein
VHPTLQQLLHGAWHERLLQQGCLTAHADFVANGRQLEALQQLFRTSLPALLLLLLVMLLLLLVLPLLLPILLLLLLLLQGR